MYFVLFTLLYFLKHVAIKLVRLWRDLSATVKQSYLSVVHIDGSAAIQSLGRSHSPDDIIIGGCASWVVPTQDG